MTSPATLRFHYGPAFKAFGMTGAIQRVLPRPRRNGVPVSPDSLIAELTALRAILRREGVASLPKISRRDNEIFLVKPDTAPPEGSSVKVLNPADGTTLPCLKALVTLFSYGQMVGILKINVTPEGRDWLEEMEPHLSAFEVTFDENQVTFTSHK